MRKIHKKNKIEVHFIKIEPLVNNNQQNQKIDIPTLLLERELVQRS